MKRLPSILTLAILLLHFAGFYVYFAVRLSAIHDEANASIKNLSKEKLTLIELSASEWQSVNDKTEMRWQGKMYDVAQVDFLGNKVLVYALHDTAEDDLLSFINEVVNNAQQDDKPVPSIINSFLSLDFVQPVALMPNAFQLATSIRTPEFYHKNFQSVSLLKDVPPPRG